MSNTHHSCYVWSCANCNYEVVGKTQKTINLKERMHKKVCKHAGRSKPKMTHTEVEQRCYGGLAKKQNSLYHNFKTDGEEKERTKIPAHMEQGAMEAKFCEYMLKQMITSLTPQFDASQTKFDASQLPLGDLGGKYARKIHKK